MKTFLKVGRVVADVCLTIFIFVVIPPILLILFTSRTDLFFGIKSFVVMTGSMEPLIQKESIIFTASEPFYQTGEIITFKRGDITVTHRIIGMRDGKYLTKGDANKSADPQPVSQNDVIGRNFFSIPYLGYFTGFIKTVPGFLLIILFPSLIFIGFEFWNVKEEYKHQVERNVLHRLNLA